MDGIEWITISRKIAAIRSGVIREQMAVSHLK